MQPVLKVHPRYVFSLEHPGGRCGEFLSWWLGQHPGCIPRDLQELAHNRWLVQDKYSYQLDNAGSQSLLFIPAHPNLKWRTKSGVETIDPGQRIWLDTQGKYVKFYWMLFWIKTGLHAFDWRKLTWTFDDIDERARCQTFFNKPWITTREIEVWKTTGKSMNLSHELKENWASTLRSTTPDFCPHTIDLDRLFFQNPAEEYLNICTLTNLEPCHHLLVTLENYHKENVDLVANYVGVPIEAFLELSNDDAYLMMHDGLQRRWLENYSFS